MDRRGLPLYGIFASGGFVRDREFRGFHVKSYEYFRETLGDFAVVTAFGSSRPEVMDNIKKIASERETFAADVPVYGDIVFDCDFVYENIGKMKTVYGLLADERSKQVYADILSFKFTGRLPYLFGAEDSPEERYRILGLSDNENYLDLGAYDGDSALGFIAHTDGYAGITCVEPDPKSLAKLRKNLAGYGAECIGCGISDRRGAAEFSVKKGRGTSRGSGISVPVTDVDSLGGGFTYIKADIEGNELAMLRGMGKLAEKKPKLAVAAYHRTEDVFTLPLKIAELNGDYRIYYRHYPYIPAWDCEFICV